MKRYPYIPENKEILYVKKDNFFMNEAREFAKNNSLDKTMPTGAVLVKDKKIFSFGANGSSYHKEHGCFRVKNNIPTGEGYELCEGCHPKNHAEAKVIYEAQKNNIDTKDSDLYLWGHFWCCKTCWDKMIDAGIKDIYLMEDSDILFNKEDRNNIIGHQFDK
jgi:dCMP deaminase